MIDEKTIRQLASGSSSRLDLWTRIIQSSQVRVMAEIGIWTAEVATHLLTQCEQIERYYMVDPWAPQPDWNGPYNVDSDRFAENYAIAMKNTAFAADRRVVLRGDTLSMIDKIPDNSLDMVYIDGDHTLRGITIDLIKVFPKIKEGGLIGGDDFINTPWQHGVTYEPTLVCPFSVYFAEAMNVPIVALPHKQFLISKTAGVPHTFTDLTGDYFDISLNKLPPSFLRFWLKKIAKNSLRRFGVNR